MRAKFINEFQRGLGPIDAMDLGYSPRVKELLRKVDVKRYFSENDLDMNDPRGEIRLSDVEFDDDYTEEMSEKYDISFDTEGDEWGEWYISGKFFDILRFMVDERLISDKDVWEADKWGQSEDFMFFTGIGTDFNYIPIENFIKVQESGPRYAPKKLNYKELADKYKPDEVKHLIIGEAPPHENPQSYFYVPRKKGVGTGFMGFPQSLPGLVFKKFLGYVPKSEEEYIQALEELRLKGVWLMDLVEDPLIVSERIKQKGKRDKTVVDPAAVDVLVNAVPVLKERVSQLGIPEENMILLNLRSRVNTALKKEFPKAKIYRSWKDFLRNH